MHYVLKWADRSAGKVPPLIPIGEFYLPDG